MGNKLPNLVCTKVPETMDSGLITDYLTSVESTEFRSGSWCTFHQRSNMLLILSTFPTSGRVAPIQQPICRRYFSCYSSCDKQQWPDVRMGQISVHASWVCMKNNPFCAVFWSGVVDGYYCERDGSMYGVQARQHYHLWGSPWLPPPSTLPALSSADSVAKISLYSTSTRKHINRPTWEGGMVRGNIYPLASSDEGDCF